MKLRLFLLVFITSILFSPLNVLAKTQSIAENPIIVQFINDMVKKHKFKKSELQALFDQAVLLPEVIERMTKPAEAWPWHRYRNLFIKQERIDQGVEFWRANEEVLRKAENKFGVPAEIIVAIIGVETRYGRLKGKFRLLDSLSTLVVDYPKRSKFFKKELEQMLLLARDEGFKPIEMMGSYAGAMGYPQFIASSYRHYAIDFSGDGVRDLVNNSHDAIGSVASYLSRHGWKEGEPIAAVASVNGGKYKKLVKKGLKPKTKFVKLADYGVTSSENFSPKAKAALIELEQKESHEHWVIFNNFYAITRYNHSQLYAMAVYQLAGKIKQTKNKGV